MWIIWIEKYVNGMHLIKIVIILLNPVHPVILSKMGARLGSNLYPAYPVILSKMGARLRSNLYPAYPVILSKMGARLRSKP
jgi:hypothetical protein